MNSFSQSTLTHLQDNPEPQLEAEVAAKMLSALGSMPRLLVYRTLLKAGSEGLTVTRLQALTQIPLSTLNHHLQHLVDAGLVGQTRVGRELFCFSKFYEVRRLSEFLLDQCCAGNETNKGVGCR
jgi:ArsR family transcriptional regulator, arsenate/arsenite/antimonite-responsive transcriptional repressor